MMNHGPASLPQRRHRCRNVGIAAATSASLPQRRHRCRNVGMARIARRQPKRST
jgi:hypothetical protein